MKRILSVTVMTAAIWTGVQAEFMIECHDGTVAMLSDASVSATDAGFSIGGYPVENVKKV